MYDDGLMLVGHHGMQGHRRAKVELNNFDKRRSVRFESIFEDDDGNVKSELETLKGSSSDTSKSVGGATLNIGKRHSVMT